MNDLQFTHTLTGIKYPNSFIGSMVLAHWMQKQRPQLRQWCTLLKNQSNSASQLKQLYARCSGIHNGGFRGW